MWLLQYQLHITRAISTYNIAMTEKPDKFFFHPQHTVQLVCDLYKALYNAIKSRKYFAFLFIIVIHMLFLSAILIPDFFLLLSLQLPFN